MSDGLDGLLKAAMQRFAQNVSVVTVEEAGAAHAMVASSVTSVSMEPPSMLVCVNREVAMFEPLSNAASFTINLLTQEHEEIANICSGGASGAARFEIGDWQRLEIGGVKLMDAAAAIHCETQKQIVHGSHVIFIGEVKGVSLGNEALPLLYHDRSYRRLAPVGLV